MGLLTEVSGEEEGFSGGCPLLKDQAVVRLPLNAKVGVAPRELIKAPLGLLKKLQLLLKLLGLCCVLAFL